ncbi:CAT RNA binding domain-containing protein [Lactococcus lactis]
MAQNDNEETILMGLGLGFGKKQVKLLKTKN